MKSFVKLVVITTLIFSSSCKKSSVASATKEASSDSCDLQAMDEKSKAAAKGAFKCSYDALKLAGTLGSGGATEVVQFIDGVSKMKSAVEGLTSLINQLNDWIKDPTTRKILNGEILANQIDYEDLIKKGLDKAVDASVKDKRSSKYQCFDGLKDIAKETYDATQFIVGLDPKRIDPAFAKDVIKLLEMLTLRGWDVVKGLSKCADAMNGVQVNKSFDELEAGWKKIVPIIDKIMVLANCGISLGYGGYVLVENTMCLQKDLNALYEGWAQTDRMEDKYVKDEINTKGDSDPGRERFHCMAKYGINLQSLHSSFDFTTKAYTCAEYCGNNGKGMNYMKANVAAIYPNSADRQTCEQVVSKAQSDDAIKVCLSNCCHGSGGCASSAWEKLKYYNL
jgi:hypothetical protein